MRKLGFGKAASIAALVASAAVVASPAQKASAQVVGGGASSITTLADVAKADARFTNFGTRYVVSGSGAGRTAFLNGIIQHVGTDGLGNLQPFVDSGEVVAFQEASLNVAFPYNVPGFDVTIDGNTAIAIIEGTVTNWNQVTNIFGETGPDLPIIRVARGDNSGTTGTLNDTLSAFGFPQIPNPPLPDGSDIPNANGQEIVVAPAEPDPFTAAAASGDDDNSGSYTKGVLSTIATTLGAIGYAETAAANFAIANPAQFGGQITGLAVDFDAPAGPTSTIAVGPTFLVFSATGNGANTEALQNACSALTDTNNILAAGFSTGELGPDAVAGGNPDCFTAINP